MNRLLLTTVSAASVLAWAPAFAQGETSGGQAASGDQQQMTEAGSGAGSASDLTCRQLSSMDAAAIPGVLYFVLGHGQGSQEGTAAGSASGGSAEMSAQKDQGSDSGGAASPETTMAAGSDGGQTDSGAGGSTETTMAEGSDGGQSGSGQGTGEPGGQGAQIVPILGYYEIPIERTVIACSESPDTAVNEVIKQQGGQSAGSQESGG